MNISVCFEQGNALGGSGYDDMGIHRTNTITIMNIYNTIVFLHIHTHTFSVLISTSWDRPETTLVCKLC